MTDASAISDGGDAFDLALRALILDESAGAHLIGGGPAAAVVRFEERAGTAVLIRWSADQDVFNERLKTAIELGKTGPVEIAVFGGPESVRALMKKSTPFFQANRIQTYHLGTDGVAWRAGSAEIGGSPLWKKLRAIERGEIDASALDPALLRAKIERDAIRAAENEREMGVFRAALRSQPPRVTWILLGLIAAMFGLELALGGAESVLALVRLGGLVSARVLKGEWWRILSASFLHAGVWHVAMNGYVLYLLGRSLEPFLGSPRFLVLYVASALGGGLASTAAGHGLSVGASGALWGLLASEGVLAFRPRGLVPAALVPQMRRGALTTLVINLAISLHPRIDLSAHLGGAVVGGLLLLSGALTHGLPTLDDVQERGGVREDRVPLAVRAASVLAAILVVTSLAAAFAVGRPWMLLDREVPFARRAVPELGISLELPGDLSAAVASSSKDGVREVTLGDLEVDRAMITVRLFAFPEPIDARGIPDQLEQLRTQLRQAPEGAKIDGAVGDIEVGGQTGVAARYEFPALIIERAGIVRIDRLELVEAATWKSYQADLPGLAARVLTSITPSR